MIKKLRQQILWLRAKEYLQRYHPPVIGVTGSADKTIAKDAIAAVLSTTSRVRQSLDGNDSRLGIAMSVLGVTARQTKQNWYKLLTLSKTKELSQTEPDIIVLALGVTRPGDIDYVASRLAFTGSVITNIQTSHLRLFTSKDLVAHEVASIVVSIPPTGFVILNIDDPLVADMQPLIHAHIITYGRSPAAQVQLLHARSRGRKGFACSIKMAGHLYELHLPNIISEQQIVPIISSLAVAMILKIDISQAIRAIQPIMPPPGHMRLLTGYNNSSLLDDSYSASPENTMTALQTLQNFPAQRKIAIIGDILNLGRQTIAAHRQIGDAAGNNADVLVAVGDNMRHAGAAALNSSAANTKQGSTDIHYFSSSRDVGKWLRDFLHPHDVVLIKGSRDMRMEEVTRRLLANPEDANQLVN